MLNDARADLRALLDRAIAVAHPARCLAAHLPQVSTGGRLIVLGAGKAAAAMAVAVEQYYRERGALSRIDGFVTTRRGYALPTEQITVIEASHPVPDAASVEAAVRSLALAATAGDRDLVLVLLSGGASALWSAPSAGIALGTKQELTRQLLRSGAPITAMNTVRKHLSLIKGGRLTLAAGRGRVMTLAISDVVGDDPSAIGSGPTVPDPTTLADARAVLTQVAITPSPECARALRDPANETPKPGHGAFAGSTYMIVAAARQSLEAAAALARELSYPVTILGDDFEGEARDAADAHARLVLAARARGENGLFLSGGELTVTIKGSGRGGRNQEFALALAQELNGAAGITALAAGTDGADGGSGKADDPAGAFIDDTTLARARRLNLNPAMFLANNDSGSFFAALGDLIVTGPTQTNVNDFRAILVAP